jgi:signal transduction histidine kinase
MRLEEISTSRDPDQVQEEARIALNQVERLTQVVDSLLARSRLTRRTAIAPIDLQLVLEEQIEEWSPAFRERRRRLELGPLEPVRVIATSGALSQVLATLIENSLQHGDGAARITARRTGRSVVVEVTDEGPGVPAHLGSRVFERTVSSSGSTGLGLSLARDLAEADGGRLELVRASPPVFALFLNAPE